MKKHYEHLIPQKSKIACGTDVIKRLEQRTAGFLFNSNNYCHDFEVHAEDVFVKKKFNELRCEMPGTPRSTFLMVFSPDGSKVASTHGNHNIYVTDVRSGKNIKTLVGHPRTPWCIAFHPTSNQILASGCLGGQVRIWDLSGGSEIWTSEIPTVIASIAFHPDDRLLVIATYNELYFWDWSKPEPFIHVATASIKEKVRYVAFDKLGHKLITGISNSPQTRWERVRAPVPVPRQVDRSASPYRRRITPRLISNIPTTPTTSEPLPSTNTNMNREPLTTVPERERRITACYRNLVREYELLVHRYLQIYRPPTMIDQGTDPMEIDLNSITGSTSRHLNGSTSQTRISTHEDLERPLFDTTSEVNSSPAPVSSQASTSVNNISTTNSNHSDNLINVPSYSMSESLNENISNLTPQNDMMTSDTQGLFHTAVSVPIREDVSGLEIPSSSSISWEIQPSTSSGSILRQENVPDSNNENLSNILVNPDKREDDVTSMAHYSENSRVQLDRHNTNLHQSSNIPENSTNNLKYTQSFMRPLLLVHNRSNTSTHNSNLQNSTTNTNETPKEIDDSEIKLASRDQTPTTSNHTPDPIILANTFKISSKNNLDTKECDTNLEKATDQYNIGPKSDSIEPASKQDREHYIKHLQAKYISSKIRDMVAINENLRNLNAKQNTSTNVQETEPTPSTSGMHRSSKNYDHSCSNSEFCQPKKENPKIHDHSRKRNYTALFKRIRRTVTDSSSDSSSSEEDILSSKRLCTTKMPSQSSNISSGNPTTNSPEQESVNNDDALEPINLNRELEVLVTDLLMHGENTPNTSSSVTGEHSNQNISKTVNTGNRICLTCGGNLPHTQVGTDQCNMTPSRITNTHTCSKKSDNTHTRTNSTTYTSPVNQRFGSRPGRFFSHRASAFYPTRIQHLRPHTRLRRSASYLSPVVRNRIRILNTLQNPSRLPNSFALDEVINYSERSTREEVSQPDIGFHPFDPPPEFASINPENIGIGNMYSNIVQELESSLNDVRNIRASNRLGETSDMLSSFSERLESIMNQSNAILRNLRSSIDTLQPTSQNTSSPNSDETARAPLAGTSQPRISFSDSNFYLREQTTNQGGDEAITVSPSANTLGRSSSQDDIFSNHNHSVATDHTYPLNSRNSESAANSMSPLMASLHLTVSHIQRQARLLRQQVESIERIDRAMLEVAQLQMMRQMFIEMQCYFRAAPGSENRSSLSRVRQMMAGTRISDSSPYDSPNDETTTENQNDLPEVEPHGSNNSTSTHQNTTVNNNPTRKSYPRCIFLMQRHFRRGSVGNILQRRCLSRERLMRRHAFRKSFTYRSVISRMPIDLTTNRHVENNQLSFDTLRSLTRRLECFLMEHGRHIGRVLEPTRSTTSTDKDEYVMMLRLNQCRTRLGQESPNNYNIRRQTNSVTTDGSTRHNAREMLTVSIESLSRYIMNGTNITPSLRISIWNVVDLSLLLSEILLLQIVDSIPPPSGMNLDSERESLSARIDQMCSRMLQNRLSGHSQQLTRSLRLTRLAVRHAARALNQTYTARRNSMIPTDCNRDQRRMLLEEINNCLRNIRRHGIVTQMSNERIGNNSENLSRTQWYRTIHSLITRYRCSSLTQHSQIDSSSSNTNTDNAAQTDTLQTGGVHRNYMQASSDDDNESYWYNSQNNRNINSSDERMERARPLYRTNNVNLFNLLNIEQNTSITPRSRPWNVPTFQINDIPISQYQSQWHPRFMTSRQRVPERVSELRTYPVGGIYRPRFLHPLHASNPFEADFDESVREQIYDSDIMTPITPNHRIQVWEFSSGIIPNIDNALKNVVVNECKIHNDASVDIANNGNILVTLLPSGGYLNGTNRLGVYSLKWETLGQCLYTANFEQNAVSVSLSPLSRHLVVGLASRRVSVIPSEKWTMARIFVLDDTSEPPNQLPSIREVEQTRDPNYMSVNCIRWLPISGQGLVYATNTGQLRILT